MSGAGEVLGAAGPQETRAAFTTAIATTSGHTDDLTGIAGVLREAADRYEGLGMSASTLGHLRDGAAAVDAAATALGACGETLQAALADFNDHDGRVAEAVAQAGNLMRPDGYGAAVLDLPGAGLWSPPPPPKTDGKVMNSNGADADGGTTQGRPDGVRDPLKVAGRLVLGPGEQFAGSGSVNDGEGVAVLAAAVQTPDGRQVHVGVVYLEDRKNWRGAHAPARETTVDDEDGEQYGVDTGSDTTVVLDAEDAARLGEIADDVIARAGAADKEFRQVCTDFDRLVEELARLQAQRFPDPVQADQKVGLDAQETSQARWQRHRRAFMDECADRLGLDERAAYDAVQQQIDAAGHDAWDPDKPEAAAAVHGLGVEEFRELQQLRGIDWRERSAALDARLDQLEQGRPALLEQQAARICGLTVDELRELERLKDLRGRRTPQEQARLDELANSPRGAIAANPRRTARMRGQYLSWQGAHHSAKSDLAVTRQKLAAVEESALPLDPATAAELARVSAELNATRDRYERMNGGVTACGQVPARNGGALVVEAIQLEDGGVQYHVGCRPAGAEEGWRPGDTSEPYSNKAAGLRKVAKLVASLANDQETSR